MVAHGLRGQKTQNSKSRIFTKKLATSVRFVVYMVGDDNHHLKTPRVSGMWPKAHSAKFAVSGVFGNMPVEDTTSARALVTPSVPNGF